jgi:hypothetical protein
LTDDRTPSLVVSYAHEDVAYVERLVDHLATRGLPVWYDAHVRYGSQFVPELRRRFAEACGVIVVMSPDAEESLWVTREILESDRRNRPMFPLLLRGEAIFLLLPLLYLDVRDGALPEGRWVRDVRGACGSGGAGPGPSQSRLVTPLGTRRPVLDLDRGALDRLSSYLEAGEVEWADIWTTKLLLQAAGCQNGGWIPSNQSIGLHVTLLDEIDRIWSRSTDGAHGFRTQLSQLGGVLASAPVESVRDFSTLAMGLGWRSSVRDTTPLYDQFVSSRREHVGFFPTLRNPQLELYHRWYDKWTQTVIAVHYVLWHWGGR